MLRYSFLPLVAQRFSQSSGYHLQTARRGERLPPAKDEAQPDLSEGREKVTCAPKRAAGRHWSKSWKWLSTLSRFLAAPTRLRSNKAAYCRASAALPYCQPHANPAANKAPLHSAMSTLGKVDRRPECPILGAQRQRNGGPLNENGPLALKSPSARQAVARPPHRRRDIGQCFQS